MSSNATSSQLTSLNTTTVDSSQAIADGSETEEVDGNGAIWGLRGDQRGFQQQLRNTSTKNRTGGSKRVVPGMIDSAEGGRGTKRKGKGISNEMEEQKNAALEKPSSSVPTTISVIGKKKKRLLAQPIQDVDAEEANTVDNSQPSTSTFRHPPPPQPRSTHQSLSLPSSDAFEHSSASVRPLKKRKRRVVEPPPPGLIDSESHSTSSDHQDDNNNDDSDLSDDYGAKDQSNTSSSGLRRGFSIESSSSHSTQRRSHTPPDHSSSRNLPLFSMMQDATSNSNKAEEEDPDRPLNPYRPAHFMHWSYDTDRFVADKIYLHHSYLLEDEVTRDDLVQHIERGGGLVVDRIREAEYVVLPPWEEDEEGYASLYWEATKKDKICVRESWLNWTLTHDRPTYRSNPLADVHCPPRPKEKPAYMNQRDASGNRINVPRYLLKVEEEEYLEELMTREKRGKDGEMRKYTKKEIWKKAENKFYNKYRHSDEDYRTHWPEFLRRKNERELNRLPAKKRAREGRRQQDEETSSSEEDSDD